MDTLKGAWIAFEINIRAGVIGTFSVVDVLGASVELYRLVDLLLSPTYCYITFQDKSAASR